MEMADYRESTLAKVKLNFAQWKEIHYAIGSDYTEYNNKSLWWLSSKRMVETAETFDEFASCINTVHNDTVIVRTKMTELAVTFENFMRMAQYSSNEELREKALTGASKLAKTFDNWKEIYDHSINEQNELAKLAVMKMSELTVTPSQWRQVERYANDAGMEDLKKIAFQHRSR